MHNLLGWKLAQPPQQSMKQMTEKHGAHGQQFVS